VITKPRAVKERERARERGRAGAIFITVHSQSRVHHMGQRLGKKPIQNTAWEPRNISERVREGDENKEEDRASDERTQQMLLKLNFAKHNKEKRKTENQTLYPCSGQTECRSVCCMFF